MNTLFKFIALAGLLLTAIGPILTFAGVMSVAFDKVLLIPGMILWFVGATPWLGQRELQPADVEVEI